MKISSKHIIEAERILIDGNEFDNERIKFIKYMDTIDLLAVPGSGKTTALLAKLYCLAKQMPFENNRGILVLAHTNHAIEEIEKVLKPVCPQLFQYPNFIGTIQSFANKYIAYPYYTNKTKKQPKSIDDEFYKSIIIQKLNTYVPSSVSYIKNADLSKITESYLDIDKKGDVVLKFKDEEFTIQKIPKTWGSEEISREYINEVKNWIIQTKISILNSGLMNYKDTYFYCKKSLHENFLVSMLLQKRFKYVFVDEMQDLDQEQIDLIETIFNTNDTISVIQRIGDKNQSIYSSKSTSEGILWRTRHEIDSVQYPENFSLNNSYRLTPTIGKLVDSFVLDRDPGYEVKGVSINNDIKPYLLIYKDENDGQKLKEKYIDLIKNHGLNMNLKNLKNGFHIISWTTDKKEKSNKWCLRSLYSDYQKEKKQRKEDFDCLRKYLYLFDHNKQTFESVRKSLLNGIIRVLRIEEQTIENDSKRYFRKSDLINLIKQQGEKYYTSFKCRLFNWCFLIISESEFDTVFIDYLQFINEDLKLLISGFEVQKSISFVMKPFDFIDIPLVNNKSSNRSNDIELNLGSIHSVKGQTHCATLYIETDYHGSEIKKLFHTDTISNPLFFEQQNRRKKSARINYDKTLKMMYVGFSRPTHLLCFAVREHQIQNHLERFKESDWQIIFI